MTAILPLGSFDQEILTQPFIGASGERLCNVQRTDLPLHGQRNGKVAVIKNQARNTFVFVAHDKRDLSF